MPEGPQEPPERGPFEVENPSTGLPALQPCRPCRRFVAFVLDVRALGESWVPVGGWDVISIGVSAAFALALHCWQVTLAMSMVSSWCGAWTPQTARPLLVSFSNRGPNLVA